MLALDPLFSSISSDGSSILIIQIQIQLHVRAAQCPFTWKKMKIRF